MLVGQYLHTLDDKGRLAMPAKFRKVLGDDAIVTRGFDTCLVVYPKGEWERLAAKIGDYPQSADNARAFARLFFGAAHEVSFDGQGRMLIPEHLRLQATLTGETVVLGVMNRVELWSEATYSQYLKTTDKEQDAINKTLQDFGF